MSPAIPISGNISSLAIVCPSWVGDVVMATPVLRAARAALPNAKIIGIMRPGLDEVLRGTPWLDDMMVCDMKGWRGPWRTAQAIRSRRAEAVLLLPNSFRAGLAARLSGAALRVGYERDGRGWLLTHRASAPADNRPIPALDYYAALAQFAFGIQKLDRRVELAVTPQEDSTAVAMLRDVRAPFVLLNPGANRADKRWPAERFAAAAEALASLHGLSIVITGSPGEAAVLSAVQRSANIRMVNLAERGITLGSLKAVVRRAALMITNDTGPRHFAAALGTPVVTLFGPTDHRWTTLHCPHEHILVAEPFLPEELVADRHGKACAIEKISVNDVISAAEALLRRARAC